MGKTIMIVEDEQSFQDFYTMMLEDTDYESFALMMEMRLYQNWKKRNLI